jgi:hypothetical protein
MVNNMSENRNCPNCGAPYNVVLSKCPYCETSYFDLSCLQINGDPFYLKIKNTDGLVITQKCVLTSVQISVDSHYTDMTTTLELRNIAEDGKLSTYYKEEV